MLETDPISIQTKQAADEKNASENPIVEKKIKNDGEQLFQRAYYVTRAQHKALKMRVAASDSPEEKDISTIVRAAIDLYLSRK